MTAALRDPPDEAVELIKAFEGIPDGDPSTVNIDAYLCPANVWTIGWGHAIVHEGQQLKGAAAKSLARQLYPGGITMDQAVALLRADLLKFCAGVQRVVKLPVNDAQFGGLLAFAFNVGLGALAQSTLLRKLNAGDVAGAADEFLRWDKARVNGVLKPLAGLTRRRRAERALFLAEDWRSVAAQPATRSGGLRRPPVLPVPEAPDEVLALQPAAVKKVAAKKVAVKAAAAKPPAAKKAATKKAATKKAPTKKAPTKAATVKKLATKKSPAKEPPAKKAPAKKAPAKKAPPKKAASKSSSGRASAAPKRVTLKRAGAKPVSR